MDQLEFYQKLDFKIIEDRQPENRAVLQHNNMVLCIYQGHIENNLINFRGGDIDAIHKEAAARGLRFSKPAKKHPDGSWSAEVVDPDGNVIFFNTFTSGSKTCGLADSSPTSPSAQRSMPPDKALLAAAERPIRWAAEASY
jgi:hypothetical protein